MKKFISLAIILISISLTSCTSGAHNNGKSNIFGSLFNLESKTSVIESSSESSSIKKSPSNNSDFPVYNHIDIDLTTMSSTMVYSQVLYMMTEPETYVGKIVKVFGPFVPFESNSPDYCYPAIMIQDATACCANGLEFLLYGVKRCSISGGNGYPLYEEDATIVGRFETYLEGTSMYVHLVDAIWLENME